MPDFERRSSASFISSKEGGTPASFSRSLMKRRSSYCLRVSISTSPQFVASFDSQGTRVQDITSETSHQKHPSQRTGSPKLQVVVSQGVVSAGVNTRNKS